MPQDLKPWEQQDDETAVAFHAFTVYRDTPADERSLRVVGQKLGKSTVLMERWSSLNRWVRRAEAWDGECDRARRKKNLRAIESMNERRATQAQSAGSALMAPIITLLQHMQGNPEYLKNLDSTDLAKLAIAGARSLRVVHAAESEARGALPLPETEDTVEEFEIEDWQPKE